MGKITGKDAQRLKRINKALAQPFKVEAARPFTKTTDWKRCNQGSGYLIPQNISPADWSFLNRHWEDALKKSGFFDIEQRDPNAKGFFSHPFHHNSAHNKSRNDIAQVYKAETLDYYRMLALFHHHSQRSDWGKKFYKEERYLLRCRIDGMTYPQIVQHIKSGKAPHYIPTSRSIFWVHTHFKRVESYMKAWIASAPEVLQYEEGQDTW